MTTPFLRWAGGKRWLARMLAPELKSRLTGSYIEPFLGSGAMYFAVDPSVAALSDDNDELINAFLMVRNHPTRLLNGIRRLDVDAATYYNVRAQRPTGKIGRAVRFIYLNRTCFGGIYRENRQGDFNVPYGGGSRTPEPLWEKGLLKNASQALAKPRVSIIRCDFEVQLKRARVGDVVYCDPVYGSSTGKETFDRYSSRGFHWEDHLRLARQCRMAFERGVFVVVSNTVDPEILNIYGCGTALSIVRKKRFGRPVDNDLEHTESLIIFDPERSIASWIERTREKAPDTVRLLLRSGNGEALR